MTIRQGAINQWKYKKKIDNWKEEKSKFQRWIKKEKEIKEICQVLQRSIRVSGDQPKEEKVKLPKLVILSVTITHIDFSQIWNQFETQIDKSDLHCAIKLSYLNDMLVLKFQLLIKGLSCNSKGYERTKTIL